MRRLALLVVFGLTGCPTPKPPIMDPPVTGRCDVDLAATKLFSGVGTGASAKVIASSVELIGGNFAQARVGDFVIANDRVRVAIQQPNRSIAPAPYGGAIIDADLVRASGPGRDEFGKMAPIYAFGRTINVSTVEVLDDGSKGGAAVIAATGTDAVVDYVNIPNVITQFLGNVSLVTDPNQPLPLLATTYFVLSPGEQRVRVLTAFCNSGKDPITMQVGDLLDQGGVSEIFNPTGCTKGLGNEDCLIDPSPWFGYQADEVAYGYRAYTIGSPTTPATNALLYEAGIAAVVVDGQNQAGVLTWVDPDAPRRPGTLGILAGGQRSYLRDFFVGRDLAEISSSMLTLDASAKSRLTVTVTTSTGQPASGARVAVKEAASGQPVTVMVVDGQGSAKADLPPGNYLVAAGQVGTPILAFKAVTVPAASGATSSFQLGPSRSISVRVHDPFAQPLSARVVVRCPNGPCPNIPTDYQPWKDVERVPSDIQAIGFAGADGTISLAVPPGEYEVLVSRGLEYSAFPDTFPTRGQAVDVRTADQSIEATLAHVVDTTGWVSADLHVHAAGSPDSAVANSERVLSFAAEGVDVLVSTDHDVITDYAPLVRDLGLAPQMATMIGCEVTPFDFGHHNAFPLVRDASVPNGGAFDWAGGDGPTLRLEQIYAGLRMLAPDAIIQMNHPRGSPGGSMTQLKIDTLTSATHADPATFRQLPSPNATPMDTKLFNPGFDAFEVMNGVTASTAVLNDWMTFLSRGLVTTATGVSDTHFARMVVGGYGRTFLKLGVDQPSQFTPTAFTAAMHARAVTVSSGPFVLMTAQRLDGGGQPVGSPVEVGGTVKLGAGERLALTVEVQAPEWMQFDSIELATHTTGREASNGVGNADWPDSRLLQKVMLDPTMLPVEAVPGLNGFAARRVHVTKTFSVTPTADTWYVALVRASAACRTMTPMVWDGVNCTAGLCTAAESRGMGLTNPIFVDADGSGAYDDFPLKPGQPLTSPSIPAAPQPRRVPSAEEVNAMLRKLFWGRHAE